MVGISFKVDDREVRRMLRKASPAVKRRLARAVNATAIDVSTQAKRLVAKGPKTGRIYRRGKIEHQASAPGEPPATDTGELISKIGVDKKPGGLTVDVISAAPYSKYLEFGTKSEEGTPLIEARPFMRPALESKKKRFKERISKAVNRGMKESSRG